MGQVDVCAQLSLCVFPTRGRGHAHVCLSKLHMKAAVSHQLMTATLSPIVSVAVLSLVDVF